MKYKFKNISYKWLLSSLLLFFFIAPLFSKYTYQYIVNYSLLAVISSSIIFLIKDNKKAFITLIVFGPSFFVSLLFLNEENIITLLAGSAFFFCSIIFLIYEIFSNKKVNLNVIICAVSVYLLMSILWSFIFALIDSFYPQSFGTIIPMEREFFDYTYFSMTNLSTLGYGDIFPLSQPAKSFAAMEAIAGQLYLTVLVARLVGMHVSQSR